MTAVSSSGHSLYPPPCMKALISILHATGHTLWTWSGLVIVTNPICSPFWIPGCYWALNLCEETTSHKLISGLCLSADPCGFFLDFFFLVIFLWMHVGNKHQLSLNHSRLHPYKTPLSSSYLKRNGLFAADGEGLDSCCWLDSVLLSYSCYSSIHSLTPGAWLVCCRELRLLLNTMSEHMQLSLAFCRIGLYTVRKCRQAAICFVR